MATLLSVIYIALYDKASYISQLQDLKLDIKYAPEEMWSRYH